MSAHNSALHDALASFVHQHECSTIDKEQYARFMCHDFAGVQYSVSYDKPAFTEEGTVAVRTSWPWQFSSSLKLADRLQDILKDGPPGLTMSQPSSRNAIVTWLLEAQDKGMTSSKSATIKWLSSLRFHVLTHPLRSVVSACLQGDQLASATHMIHINVSIVTVPKAQALQVIIPLSSSHKDDEPFARALLHAITDAPTSVRPLPKYTFWEANAPPEELQPFPAVLQKAALGYLSVELTERHLTGSALEHALASIVHFPDMLQFRTTSCRRLVRTELACQLARMQSDLRMRGVAVEKAAEV